MPKQRMTFTKDQRQLAKNKQNGRLMSIGWQNKTVSALLTGPATEKQFRYIQRALLHVQKLGRSS